MMVPTNNHARHAKGRKKRLRRGQPAFGAKLDSKLRKKFCKHVREGLSFETVCALCRVGRATFYQWMQRGRAEEGTPYAEFAAAVEEAESDAVRTLHIRVAASNPQWILERRHPFLYGLKLKTELSGPEGKAIPTDMGARFTVIVNCPHDDADLEKLMPVVDGTTGLPVPDDLNPYKNKHRANGASTGEQE
jgi:hypothetical protein